MTPIEVFREAKLKPRHVAHLLGVSRVTASLWLNGHVEPHVLLADKVVELVGRIRVALDDKRLPVPSGVVRGEELQYIDRVLGNKQ